MNHTDPDRTERELTEALAALAGGVRAAPDAYRTARGEWLRAHHGMDEYIEAMKRAGAARGQEAGVAFAEGFVQHRGHPYPQNDVLAELFGKENR